MHELWVAKRSDYLAKRPDQPIRLLRCPDSNPQIIGNARRAKPPHQHSPLAQTLRQLDAPAVPCRAKTKFAADGNTSNPKPTSAAVIRWRSATIVANPA